MPKNNLRVEVIAATDHPGGVRRNMALISLFASGGNGEDDSIVMTESVTGDDVQDANRKAEARADEIRQRLRLYNCYSVSDGQRKLFDVYAVDMVAALPKIGEQLDKGTVLKQLLIDYVEPADERLTPVQPRPKKPYPKDY